MHTLMILFAGLLLLGICLIAGRVITGSVVAGAGGAIKAFIPLWLLVALGNMWVGVASAGYTVAQEAPIFLVVFLVPAIAAWLVGRALT